LRNLAEARELIADSFAPELYIPEDTGVWDDAYVRFRNLIGE